jgi:Fe2+ transport system protein FeoA
MALKEQVMRLDQMDARQVCVVHDIEAPDDDLERLMSMGVCRGRVLTLIQRGDPLILKVFGSRLGVSARLARRVHVACCTPEDRDALNPVAAGRTSS